MWRSTTRFSPPGLAETSTKGVRISQHHAPIRCRYIISCTAGVRHLGAYSKTESVTWQRQDPRGLPKNRGGLDLDGAFCERWPKDER
jgi:hypothetical protein